MSTSVIDLVMDHPSMQGWILRHEALLKVCRTLRQSPGDSQARHQVASHLRAFRAWERYTSPIGARCRWGRLWEAGTFRRPARLI